MEPLLSPFPYDDVANKIAMSLAIGLLVGFEREWAGKEVGVRTFAIIALLGTLSMVLDPSLMMASSAGVFLIVALLNTQTLITDRSLELTTSAAMMMMLMLGALVGKGHYFTSATSAILLTMLLAWKVELARFADALKPDEIRGAVLLGLLTFVVYPLLPNRFIDSLQLINPRQSWVTIVAIAGIGFVNYVLLRVYSTKGLYYAAILGGMVNSTATVVELSASLKKERSALLGQAEAILLLTNIAMFLRNLVLLGLFSRPSVGDAFLPLTVMSGVSVLVAWNDRDIASGSTPKLELSSPVSVRRIAKFGSLFLLLACVGTLAQRYFGNRGFLVVSVLGGLISSASTTATAAQLAMVGQISSETAGISVVLTAISSALVNLPLVYQQTQNVQLTKRLALITGSICCLGLAVMLLTYWLHHHNG
jgi:uncharacterized membrane protein (DUF4010 family)